MTYSGNRTVNFIHLGEIDYKSAWEYQDRLFLETVNQKVVNRKLREDEQVITRNYLIFCAHPHVYTLGRMGDENHLLLNHEQLVKRGAQFYRINRGGDITYHGPGQIVCYPILDLHHFFTDIHKYMRYLEEAVIETLGYYGITAARIDGLTGVWLPEDARGGARKICALGVKASRWVTMHGLALNVNTDLSYFNDIVPCGIQDKSVTSMAKELGYELDVQEVEGHLKNNLVRLFEMELIE